MKKSLVILGIVSLLVIIVGSIAVFAAPLPGIGKTPDSKPNGCVDCHAVISGQDRTMAASLKKYPKHPTKGLDTLKGCYACHEKRGDMGALMHAGHLSPADNKFITTYDGNCTNCHAVDAKTGKVTVKGK